MLKARPEKEVVVRIPNKIGALDELAELIADKGVNILAVTAWVEEAQAVMRLVTDDELRVVDALRRRGHDVRELSVLVTEMPHKPGILHRVAETLAQGGIDIRHLYATAASDQERCLVVFNTENNERAMVLLNALKTAT